MLYLTLCGLKKHRFFKTCVKGIVNHPPTRSKQLPVRQVLRSRLLLCFFAFRVHQILAVLHSIFYLYLFTQATVKSADEISQGFLLIKILLCVDGCSYLHPNYILSSAINCRWHFLHRLKPSGLRAFRRFSCDFIYVGLTQLAQAIASVRFG